MKLIDALKAFFGHAPPPPAHVSEYMHSLSRMEAASARLQRTSDDIIAQERDDDALGGFVRDSRGDGKRRPKKKRNGGA